MRRPPSFPPFSLSPLVALCLTFSACGDDAPEPFESLDPTQVHYGKTFAEWAADWMNYAYSYRQPACEDPVKDATGAVCAKGQDPASPVFFLVGTYGGPAERTECVVPSDAALFFPLANSWADNTGLPADKLFTSPQQIKDYVEEYLPGIYDGSFYATVDGRPVKNLEAGFGQEATPYTLHVPEGGNSFTCDGVDGVSGDFPGYVLGAWVMLPPLGAGEHIITFGSSYRALPPEPAFTTDVRYELKVVAADER